MCYLIQSIIKCIFASVCDNVDELQYKEVNVQKAHGALEAIKVMLGRHKKVHRPEILPPTSLSVCSCGKLRRFELLRRPLHFQSHDKSSATMPQAQPELKKVSPHILCTRVCTTQVVIASEFVLHSSSHERVANF